MQHVQKSVIALDVLSHSPAALGTIFTSRTIIIHFLHLLYKYIFIPLHINLTIFKIKRLGTVKEMSTLSYPRSCCINFRT
jgi:hypothetical protein